MFVVGGFALDLSIAGLPLCIESADTEFFNKRFADYQRDDGREPVMRMRTTYSDNITVPEEEELYRRGSALVLRLADGRVFRCERTRAGTYYYSICTTPDYSDVEIQLDPTVKHPYFTVRELEYVYTGASFADRIYKLGGGVLHSSSLAYRGQGIAFSANSGTGKSTQVNLWKQYFPDDVEIINDDKPAILFDGDRPMLCGTPWSGKTDLNLNRQVPLKAVVFVERGTDNTVRRLDAMESMYCLLGQFSSPYYDASLGELALNFAQRLYESVPMYCLSCDISRQAVDAVYNAIIAQEEK